MFTFSLLFTWAIFCAVGASPWHHLTDGSGRIVGGADTTIEKFPHQVSFRMFSYHRCGGVIIRPDVVATAAHCVDGQDIWYLSVMAGSTEWDGDGVVRNVKEYFVHEDYSIVTIESDIALLVLEGPFELGQSIKAINLAGAGEEFASGTKALVSGWGTLIEDGPTLPQKLQSVEVSIWSSQQCKEAYDGVNVVTDSMVCAGDINGGIDACSGDSGGPLIVGNKLVGLVSWGLGCARPGFPSVYSKISYLRPWIESKIGKGIDRY